MMISLKWISDFVDVNEFFSKPEDLGRLLTSAGLEVEGIKDSSAQFKNVVIGHIVEKGVHPDADRLTLCQVDAGSGSLQQIVCGAKNHQKGDKVVVALPGAVLPGDFQIKLSKIRGVESAGMLASESELGLSKESEGILILPSEAPIGKPFAEYYGLDDVIFEINVTPNRADCLSHYGLAREIAALLNRPLKEVKTEVQTFSGLSVKSKVKLSLKNEHLCPRYSGRFVSGVKVGATPTWIKSRLESLGMNSINNVVDITNYVMIELGQPLHAFDASQLSGAEVLVDNSKAGEKFVTLDGTELTLTGEELTIRDQERAVCLAGVVGGKNSGVSDSTTDIFLESAHFSMESVRKTSRKYGLQTDSAYRFSRGTDISNVVHALNRAAYLLQTECGGKVSEDFYDLYPKEKTRTEIAVKFSYVSDRLGYAVDGKDFCQWMKRLGLEMVSEGPEQAVFRIPNHRGDLEQEVDLVEEFGRLNGYDKIPEELPHFSTEPITHDTWSVLTEQVSAAMIQLGYSQAVNYGFVSEKRSNDLFNGEAFRQVKLNFPKEFVRLKNPLSEEMNVMRTSLVPGLLMNMTHNFRYGNKQGRLFESGSRFAREGEAVVEEPMLAAVIWGNSQGLWEKGPVAPLFFELKTGIERLFQKFQLGGAKGCLQDPLFGSLEFRAWDNGTPSFLHPGQSATIFCEGRTVGYIGALHPTFLSEEKVAAEAAIMEVELEIFLRAFERVTKAKTPSKFQMVERDLSFLAKEDVTAGSIMQVIKKAAGPLLQAVTVTDEFRGGDLSPGEKSLSFRFILQDEQGTLQDKALLDLQNQIIDQVQKKLGVKLR